MQSSTEGVWNWNSIEYTMAFQGEQKAEGGGYTKGNVEFWMGHKSAMSDV